MKYDVTTDPSIRSFVEVGRRSHFPIQNLPYGIFTRPDADGPRVGVAIGDSILDCAAIAAAGLFEDDRLRLRLQHVFAGPTLNPFLELGTDVWKPARRRISELLRSDTATIRDDAALRARALVPMEQADLLLPVEIGDYTDFYSSREHATNVGTMFRGKENALMPNWLYLPVGYHGRASSIVVSGVDIRRPSGQTKPDDGPPTFGPSRLLDFELEMGFFIGPGNALGSPIAIERTADHMFGMVIVNDWSARDIQKWEYVPLGPFLGKSFATTISPWVVTMDALEPFRKAGPAQDPPPLPYLRDDAPGAYDVHLEVAIHTVRAGVPTVVCRSNLQHLYWSMRQQLAHHTVNGCNVRPGDLMASGTISGPSEDSYGSLLELSWRGSRPLVFPGGETRTFLEDGDTVTMTGWAQADGYRVGFGEARAAVLPALP